MIRSNDYLEKGYYSHRQYDGVLQVKQFMLIRKNGKRCLLLRFVNGTAFEINSMEFAITQRNSAGKVIETKRVRFTDLKIPSKEIYAADEGIAVSEACVDFTVKVLYVVSGRYKYTFKGARALSHYDVRGYSESEPCWQSGAKQKVVSQKTAQRRLSGAVAILLLVCVICAGAAVSYFSGGSFGSFLG
jgi:hypothetical protein